MQSNSAQQINGTHASNTSGTDAKPLGANAMINLAKIASSQTPQTPGSSTVIRPKLQNIQPAQQLRPIQGATISLPPGINLSAGTVLMRNEKGQLVIVSRPIAPNPGIQPVVNIRPNPVPIPNQGTATPKTAQITSVTTKGSQSKPSQKAAPHVNENVLKCKNFLETLLRLSAQQPPETLTNVKNLIRGLLDGSVPADTFTTDLQKELNSQRQPGLAPFLNKSLPELQAAVMGRRLSIIGLGNDWIPTATKSQPTARSTSRAIKSEPMSVMNSHTAKPTIVKSVPSSQAKSLAPSGLPSAVVSSLPDKKQHLAHAPSNGSDSGLQAAADDKNFLNTIGLRYRLASILRRKGLKQMSADVLSLMSDSCKDRLQHLISRTIVAAEHRLDLYKVDPRYEQSGDVRSQMKFLESLERLEKKRKDDLEREALMRAAKSRTKTEDPEQAKLKQKAKEMQQAELEVARQRDANLAALAAIGPRKRKNDEAAVSGPISSTSGGLSLASASQPQVPRLRLKKLNLRDLQYVSEQDRRVSKSSILYKTHINAR